MIWRLLAWVGIIGCSLGLAYIIAVGWAARLSIHTAPKVRVFVCNIHGPMPVDSTLILFNGDMDYETTDGVVKRGPIRYCSICFENKIKEARTKAKA
jgi:hypothetical protein